MVPLTISHLVMNIGIINLQPRFQLNMNMLANQVRWRRAFNLSTYYIYIPCDVSFQIENASVRERDGEK